MSRAASADSARVRYPLSLFVVLLGLLLTWTIAAPLFTSPDEPAHLYKAYGTAHGELLGDPIPDMTSNIRLFHVPAEMGTPNLECYFWNPDASAGCASGANGGGVSTAAIYPPFWYAVVGGTARVIAPTSQRAYRAVGATMCALLMTAAFVFARRSKARRLSPLLLVAFTPMTLFLSATVNPNGFEIAAFLLLWTLLLHVHHPRASSWQGGALVGGLVAAVLLSRFASLIWVAVAIAVFAIFIGFSGIRRFLNRRFLLPSVGGTLGAIAVLMVWSRYSNVEMRDDRLASELSRAEVFKHTVRLLPEFTRQMIGLLGWLDTRMPTVTYVAFGVMTLICVIGVIVSRHRRLQWATLAVFAGLAGVPVMINVLSASRAGLIWQGRYGLALFACIGVLGMIGWHAAAEAGRTRQIPVIRLGVSALFVIAEVAGFWQFIRRYAVGAHGKIWLTEPMAWHPAIAPMPLIAINAALVSAFVVIVLMGTRDTPFDTALDVPGTGHMHSVIVGQPAANTLGG